MKRIKNLLSIVFLILIFSFKTNKECKNFFEGTWKYKRFNVSYIYVKRTLKKQYEFMENGKYYYEFNIKWLSNCKYELTYIGTTSPKPASVKRGEKFYVKIIEINGNQMKYKTTFRGSTEVDEMEKIVTPTI